MLVIFDFIKNKDIEITLDKDKDINIYVCGPTLYSRPHIGNLRSIFIFSVLTNFLTFMGYKVNYVSNITDIGHTNSLNEDKVINASKEQNLQYFISDLFNLYVEDIKKLKIIFPEFVFASDLNEEYILEIHNCINKNFVEKVEDGIIFNNLSTIDHSKLISDGKRIKPFYFWRKNNCKNAFKSYEFGNGIPGWHIECATIIKNKFNTQLDIHGGGIDLADIHHNCEIIHHYLSQNNYDLTKAWMHVGHVMINNKKMSKTSKNTLNLDEVMNQYNINLSILKYMYLSKTYYANCYIDDKNISFCKKQYNKILEKIINLFSLKKEINNNYDMINFIESYKFNIEEVNEDIVYLLFNGFHYNLVLLCKLNFVDFVFIDIIFSLDLVDNLINNLKIIYNYSNIINKRETFKSNRNYIEADKITKYLNTKGIKMIDMKDKYFYYFES